MSEDLPDGIYFDLPHDQYVQLPRLGSSAIKALNTSPATFWHSSWMNPNRPEEDRRGRDPRNMGTAYHMARLEPDRFEAIYSRGFDRSAHPEALRTDDDVCAALKDLGETQKKAGESAADRALRLKGLGYDGEILALLEARHNAENTDTIPLAPDIFDNIERASEQLRNSREADAVLSGGLPEVTVLWTIDGFKMRARLDYLRPDGFTDLKTFSNPYGKVVDHCVVDAFRYNRYFAQAALYHAATEEIRTGDLAVKDGGEDEVLDSGLGLVTEILKRKEPMTCDFVFVQSDGSPNILTRKIGLLAPAKGVAEQSAGAKDVADFMVQPSRLLMRGRMEIDAALRIFDWASETFLEGEPWGPAHPTGWIEDADYHDSFLDGEGR